MANPQPENGFVQLANEIWNEIIRRDFSKRQKDIVFFIWRLSYGCKKKTALIPLLKDFELCGIGYQNIRKELDHLSGCRVISWDKNTNVFSVNKDYDQWQISPVKGWDEKKFKDLISKNLNEKKVFASQNKKPEVVRVTGEIIYTSQNKKWLLLKTRSVGFSKQEVRLPSNPYDCKVKGVSKDIIKNNIKDSSCCLREDESETHQYHSVQNKNGSDSQDAVPAEDTDSNRKAAELDYRKQVTDLYLKRRAKGIELSPKDESTLDELISDKLPIQFALEGIKKSFDSFKPKHKRDEIKSLSYCMGLIYSLHAASQKEIHMPEESKTVPMVEQESPNYSEEDIKKMLADMRSKRGDD
ncbi:MAG: replication protein [Paenibacillus sp.]|nr:replication protein [Paenibacillus sp.]